MKKILLLLLPALIMSGCIPFELTEEQVSMEREAVVKQIEKILQGYSQKNIKAVMSAFSNSHELMAFGTEENEIITTLEEWEQQMNHDFSHFDSARFEPLQNLSVHVSKTGDLATAVFEAPVVTSAMGVSKRSVWRYATTFKKEEGMWRIVSWLSAKAAE